MSIVDSHGLKLAVLVVATMCLSACGGHANEVAATPPPPPQVITPPPPPEAPTLDLVAPAQSIRPAIVEAVAGGPSFAMDDQSGLGPFPTTHTAVAPNFDGDAAENARPRSYYPDYLGDGQYLGYADGGRNQRGQFLGFDLDWTRYGYWLGAQRDGVLGAWVAGFQTPVAAIPVNGSARYVGKVVALYGTFHLCNCASYATVTGDVTMTADFSARAVAGTMTNMLVTAETSLLEPMNDIGFAAAFASDRNQFTGTTSLASAGSGPWALAAGASGAITGHFYGPGAQEAGAAWTLSDGTRRVIGSFGAVRQ